MDLINRYLQAVKFWLPEAQKNDIAAELSEDIDAQIAEGEVQLGRPVNEAEVGEILKRIGRPVLVANRYFPRESLIGPILFPVYRFVLKIAMLGYMAPSILVWIGLMVYSPGYRATHNIGSLWGYLWSVSFIVVGVVTAVFAVLERAQEWSHFLENWDPRKLPAVRNPTLIPRANSSLALAANLFALIFWATKLYSPTITFYAGFQVMLSPIWNYIFWGYLLTLTITTVGEAVNLWRPYWTVQRASLRLFTDMFGSALLLWLQKTNIVIGFASPDVSPTRAIELVNATNLWLTRMVPIGIVTAVIIAVSDIYRIARLSKKKTSFLHESQMAI